VEFFTVTKAVLILIIYQEVMLTVAKNASEARAFCREAVAEWGDECHAPENPTVSRPQAVITRHVAN
jgi:hypothetical protein